MLKIQRVIKNMIFIFALILLINAEQQCQPCYWNGQPFSCGAIAWFTSNYHACCDGSWCTCTRGYPNGLCGCCGIFNDNLNTLLLDDSYYFTKDGKLFTTMVTKVIKNEDGTFDIDEKVPSEELNVGDLVLWPQFDLKFNSTEISVTENIVMTVGHHNVTQLHNRCCASISVSFPPSCQVKFCCGNNCCC